MRGISGGFPYYGALETEPASAARDFHRGANALVDENVMLQLGARVGDILKIGEREFRIAAKLRKIPGETLAFSLIRAGASPVPQAPENAASPVVSDVSHHQRMIEDFVDAIPTGARRSAMVARAAAASR